MKYLLLGRDTSRTTSANGQNNQFSPVQSIFPWCIKFLGLEHPPFGFPIISHVPEVTWWHHRTPFNAWGLLGNFPSARKRDSNRRNSISNNLKMIVSLKKKKLLLHCPHYKTEIDLINLSKTKVVVKQSVYFLFVCFCFLTSDNSLNFPFKHEFPRKSNQKRTKWKVLNFSLSPTLSFSLSPLTGFYSTWPHVFLCPFLGVVRGYYQVYHLIFMAVT